LGFKYIQINILLLQVLLFYFEEYYLVGLSTLINLSIQIIQKVKNVPILIVLSYCLYISIEGLYHFQGFQISFHSSYLTDFLLGKFYLIVSLFTLMISLFSPNYINIDINIIRKPNVYHFWIMIIILFMIYIFALTGQSILTGGSIFTQTKYSIYEYFPGIFLIAFLFHNRQKKIEKIILTGLAGLYIAKSLFYFARIEVIQMMFILVIISNRLSVKIKNSSILTIFLILFIVNNGYETIRNNPAKFLRGEMEFFQSQDNNNLVRMTHGGDIVQASTRILGLIDDNQIQLQNRIIGLPKFLLNTFFLFKEDQIVHLTQFKKKEFSSGGGGLMPIYFYTWTGYLGVIVIGYIVSKIMRNRNVYSLMFIACSLRAIGYSPILLVKYILYIAVLYIFFTKIKLKNI